MALWRGRRENSFDPDQLRIEGAPRGRLARRIRGHLRRLEPIAMLTPRWSAPQSFLEDVALDLAVGEPEIGCRTVSFRPLMGRSTAEARNFLLRVLGELGGDMGYGVPMVVDRRGFMTAAGMMLDAAQEDSDYPVALLAHGAEHVPVEILEDLVEVWSRYVEDVGSARRFTMLLAGSVDTPGLAVDGATRIDLADFGEHEAAESLIVHIGQVDAQQIERAARFSGGVPAIVQALGTAGLGGLSSPEAYLRAMGPLGEEIRGAVLNAMAMPHAAERLHDLFGGEPRVEEPELDRPLLMSGILRRVRKVGPPQVALRSPAIAAAAG